MKNVILGVFLALVAETARAGTIGSACLGSGGNANPRLCACIQMAADQTLTRRDQRLAATFFRDPDRAEEVRMSKRRTHESFWQRYKAFGAFAASVCS